MPSATLDALALRSTNPVSRAIDVICVVMLQLLTLMVVAAEQDPHKLRNHRFLGPHSILTRLEAGETFDLPLILVAEMRNIARSLRAELRIDSIGAEPSSAPIPAEPKPLPAKAKRRRSTSRHAPPAARSGAPHNLKTMPPRRDAASGGLFKRKAHPLQGLSTSSSLRYRNEPRRTYQRPLR